MILFSLDSE